MEEQRFVRSWRLGLVGCVTLLCFSNGSAQELEPGLQDTTEATTTATSPATDTSPTDAEPATSVPPTGPARAKFDAILSEWKAQLEGLRDIEFEFRRLADVNELADVRENYFAKVAEARETVPQLRQAALDAFAEAPDQDLELTQFLIVLAQDALNRDLYDEALQISTVMIDHDTQAKVIYDTAGVAAFATHRFDLAQQYFDEASKAGVLKRGEPYQAQTAEIMELWQEEQAIREKEAEADDLPRVKLTTSKGAIVLELFENEAPQTVGNFIHLVEEGFYNGLAFHRVLPGFMAQGGDPKGDGTGGPGYTIYCECTAPNHRNHFSGSLSMAKSANPDTGGSQFFLTFMPTPHLNGKHTVFGRVIEGMDVVAKLQRRDPNVPEQRAIAPDQIVRAEVIRKRDHKYVPNKVQ